MARMGLDVGGGAGADADADAGPGAALDSVSKAEVDDELGIVGLACTGAVADGGSASDRRSGTRDSRAWALTGESSSSCSSCESAANGGGRWPETLALRAAAVAVTGLGSARRPVALSFSRSPWRREAIARGMRDGARAALLSDRLDVLPFDTPNCERPVRVDADPNPGPDPKPRAPRPKLVD